MKQDTALDSVLFQLKDGGARCELWVCDGETKEKLASGSLTPFLFHLDSARQQVAGGVSTIKLQPPPSCPIGRKKSHLWFNKRTIERFVRFVSTPDVLERVSALETERIKLAEASNALVSGSTSASQAKLSFSVAGGASPDTGGSSQGHDVGGEAVQSVPPSDCLDVEAESSKKHLMNAMDARLLILEKEQAKAFARAASAGFHADTLGDLIIFAHCFGATRLREACEHFSTLHKEMQGSAKEGDPMATEGSELAKSLLVQQDKMEEDEERNRRSTSVRNYGRRRVWGPPVLDISPRRSSSITDSGPIADDSTGVGPSPSSDSDWEDTEENSRKPIYANVIGELEGAESAEAVNQGVRGVVERQDQSQQTAIRRKGILVTSSPAPEKVGTETDADSQQMEGLKKRPGRLSVQDAIHLFESKQKQDSALQRTISVSEKNVKNVTQLGDQQENLTQVPERLESFQSTPVFSPAADRSGEVVRDLIGSGEAKGQSPDVSKLLLDRSYNCLLKINSVVQDALFPKLPPAAMEDLQPKTDSDVVPEECEWRPLSNTPAYVLDDMFVGSRTPVAVRRQSLCTPSEYKTTVDSPSMKGRLYDQYQEIREAKKRELALMKASREEKMAAMQDELQRRKTLSVVKGSSRFPTRTTMEQMQAVKTQATRNSVGTAKQDVRSNGARIVVPPSQRATVVKTNMQLNAKPDSPTSRTSTTRKLSPGSRAAPTTLRGSSRMVPSPPFKQQFNSSSSNATHRRPANLIAEPTALQRLRTRPLLGRNVTNSSNSQAVVPSSVRIPHPRSDSGRLVRKGLETTRVAGSSKPGDYDVKERQPPSPVKLIRSVEATERSTGSRGYQARSISSPEPQATEPRQAEGPREARVSVFKKKEEGLKTNEECIKQIVSCIRAQNQSQQQQEQEQEQGGEKEAVTKAESFRFVKPASEPLARSISDIGYNGSTSDFPCMVRVDELKRIKSFKEQLEEVSEESFKEPNLLEAASNCSQDLDEDMQIDEPLVKCVSGRTLANIGSSVFSQLRASHSLPHLEFSESPRIKSSREQEQQQEQQQPVEVHQELQKSVKDQQKHQPKGLKRLLKFGRKSRASSDGSDTIERSTAKDVKAVSSSSSSSSNSVRRSLEALPKIADAASEMSRNFFSTFRTKNSGDSRPRA